MFHDNRSELTGLKKCNIKKRSSCGSRIVSGRGFKMVP